jgi:nitroimidazol reductase NimA-like FMN-containing flavoprotein (pyridoxamine 5'-phosphate oxidase superfamily)
MGKEEMDRFLSEQRVVRICFHAFDQLYLIPLDYVWVNGNLCGLTISGQKVAMGQSNPKVAFQVDNSTPATGPWTWRSVTGQGIFELVVDPQETEQLSLKIQAHFSDVPPLPDAPEAA